MTDRQYFDWPAGYWPLHTRLREKLNDKVVVAKPGSPITIEPLGGDWPSGPVDYYTREAVWPPIVAARSLVTLLVPKGRYRLTWQPTRKDSTLVTQDIDALDPLDTAYAVKFRDGKNIWIRTGRWDQLILNEQQHRKLPLKGQRVLDAGGHIGTFTRDAINQGAEFVVAYEPDIVNYTLFKANTAHIDPAQLVHFNRAIGGEAGTATLSLNLIGEGGGNALHSIHSRPSDRPKVTVQMDEFVAICEEHQITCAKLDVEDAEGDYDYSRLPACVKYLSVETKYFEDVPRRLKEAGFTIDLKPFNTSNRAITGVVARP